jgi:hypothetical protein
MVAAIVAREFLVSGLRLAVLERGVVMQARGLGKLKTWSQATAAGIGGFAAAGAWDDRGAWWALLGLARADLGLGARLHPGRTGTAARPDSRSLIVLAQVVQILADSCLSPGASISGRERVVFKQALQGGQNRRAFLWARLGADLGLHRAAA